MVFHRRSVEWLEDKDVNDLETIELAKTILLLLGEQTYDNKNVVAASRIQTGQPGLM
jgi:hypothetical protein